MTDSQVTMAADPAAQEPTAQSQPTSPMLKNAIHRERHMRIIVIGAGASGLIFAYKLQRSFRNFTLTVYEKNSDISGTWFENRYPGCACDVPAHVYTFSFEPKTDYSSVYSGSKEISDYFNNFAQKYGLRSYCKVNHQVTKTQWDEKKGGYHVEVTQTDTGNVIHDFCDILINAAGILNAWRWPAIPGIHDYKGNMLHTANWDPNIDLTGKRVGLIGNGSSGIQVLPSIQPIVGKLTTFIREPTWVSPAQGLEPKDYSEMEKKEFAEKPEKLLEYRKALESDMNALFPLFTKNSDVQRSTRDFIHSKMKEKLRNPHLESKLIPQWSLGCRRMTPGVNYLESLSKDNVEVVCGEIVKVTEKGPVCDNNVEYPVDILICATGFDTSFRPRFPLIGKIGTDLREEWKDIVKGYLGLAAPNFPNYFMFLGPNCPIGNGPVLVAIEAQCDYMLKIINRWQVENIHSFSPKMDAVEDFLAQKDEFMKGTVWDEECRSWYKNNNIHAKVSALWPGSTLHYLEAMREPRYEDWEWSYNGNRFSYLGNGFSRTELDRTADWAYYIANEDTSPFLSTGKAREVFSRAGSYSVDRQPATFVSG